MPFGPNRINQSIYDCCVSSIERQSMKIFFDIFISVKRYKQNRVKCSWIDRCIQIWKSWLTSIVDKQWSIEFFDPIKTTKIKRREEREFAYTNIWHKIIKFSRLGRFQCLSMLVLFLLIEVDNRITLIVNSVNCDSIFLLYQSVF